MHGGIATERPRVESLITEPSTPEAKLWNGWKSHGLKPAYEPIIVAMKPNEGTYAQNALKHGVSGLWIDGGRIGTEERTYKGSGKSKQRYSDGRAGLTDGRGADMKITAQGRFPANIILDEEAAKMLDEQSGELGKSSGGNIGVKGNKVYGEFGESVKGNPGFGDKGGASRFFYTAKASKSERNMGLEGFEEKTMTDYGSIKKSEGRTGINTPQANNHPTVKPLALMEYLCTLTKTPTGGIVLDPFAGSGTTGLAAKNTGRDYILIEKEEEYVKIAEARLKTKQRILV